MALCARLQKHSPPRRWSNRSESHVEKYHKRSCGASLESFWGSWAPWRVILYPLRFLWGILVGSFGRAFFWDPWGGLLVLRDSFGDQVATKWEPDGDQLGPSGDHMRSSGDDMGPSGNKSDQVGTKCGPSGDQMGPSEAQVGPSGNQVGTKWGPTTKIDFPFF